MERDMWRMWSGQIDDKIISDITTKCDKIEISNCTLGQNGKIDDSYRRSHIRWVDGYDSDNKFIIDLLWYYGMNANRYSFGFDINYIDEIQYTTYNSENLGKYDWHHDTHWDGSTAFDRKLTVVIQLSDPSEYEGGEFEFASHYCNNPNSEELKRKGTVIVFPSYARHRVSEVTKGVRKSLVGWIEGPRFK